MSISVAKLCTVAHDSNCFSGLHSRANRFGLTAGVISAPEPAVGAACEKAFTAIFTISITESKRRQHAIAFFDGPYVHPNLLYDPYPFVTGSEARFPVRFFAAIEP